MLQGIVRWFDLKAGSGMIARDDGGEDIFFNFTAIPGEGYRTLEAGVQVRFELVEGRYGLTAYNVQPQN
ncbi:MAG: cold shock domain-containing protein [Phormidesmis sp. CAN_BIN44]|nr:cold shock domain-containing protein [Phormidesmis sp. CAN_BIN44]